MPTPSDQTLAASPSIIRPSKITQRVSFLAFTGCHIAIPAALWTGVSARSLILAFCLYWMHMFAITGGYHRYFSHRTYKTSRWFQFVLAWFGTMTVQKGPIWWAGKHRHHHKHSDLEDDVHSPRQKGFYYSHIGWILSAEHVETDLRVVKDLVKFPELVWIGKYHWIAPSLMGIGAFLLDGWRGFFVGAGWALVAAWHCTFAINSVTHLIGSRRYKTADDSRNNFLTALLTMGEGWHNNHHHYQHTVKQGFFWWEIDMTYYVLRALAAVGIVWDLKMPPARVLAKEAMSPEPFSIGAGVGAAVAEPEPEPA